MDINFHYFAVKTIARFAGFSENEAQRIAGYSQFVDDYNPFLNYTFETIPDFMLGETALVSKSDGGYTLKTIQTGFPQTIDYAPLFFSSNQISYCVPFHFITQYGYQKNKRLEERYQYRTLPAGIDGTQLISEMLQATKATYLRNVTDNITLTRSSLEIKIGMLLHIFADTYAHQRFSGVAGWENYASLISSSDNYTTKDEGLIAGKFFDVSISVGHMWVGTVPDETYLSFTMKQARNSSENSEHKYSDIYSRSNTRTFLYAARQIYTYLYQLKNNDRKPTIADEMQWEELSEILRLGFNARGNNIEKLKAVWTDASYDAYNYAYDAKDFWQNQLTAQSSVSASAGYYVSALDDFFLYNLYAKQIRSRVIGY